MSNRVGEFTVATKRRLADDAGGRCSLPDCRVMTQGPGVRVGRAAHICSAAPRGPRGQGGLSTLELASERNGIWCCASHADQIDSGNGALYTAGTLIGYKELAHARALVELKGGLVPKSGWFHGLVLSSRAFPPGSTLRFGKATFLLGRNGTGKTVLAGYLAGFADPRQWQPWLNGLPEEHSVSIRYFDPEPRTYGVTLGHRRIERTRDGQPDMPVAVPVCIRYCSLSHFSAGDAHGLDDLAESLGESSHVVAAVLGTLSSPDISGARVTGSQVEVQLAGSGDVVRWTKMSMLSAGEQSLLRFLIELAVTRRRAQDLPTLLVVDDLPGVFDTRLCGLVLGQLADPDLPFQTLVLAREDPGPEVLDGWTRVELVAAGQQVRLAQEMF